MSMILLFNEVGGSSSSWSSHFLLVVLVSMDLSFTFVEEVLLFAFTVVKHLNVDSESVVKVIVIARPCSKEPGKDLHDLESLDKSIALDSDLGLWCIWSSRGTLMTSVSLVRQDGDEADDGHS
ncbi:uncharacterized protein ARMOST_02291 [Armillaria ostoyae]|uniref:Uncharacterized protein n=1 Tax=Armillaria ostoyae TaxID=47428 RepID=A0A284QRB0_ARMOS|nr:uncharacterized protein ARMOST_02291 [Armillaria ostoyae]